MQIYIQHEAEHCVGCEMPISFGHSVIHVPFATTLEAKGVEESEGVVGF